MIVTRVHIICDGCGETYGVDLDYIPGTKLRKQYHSDGWIYSYNKDLCPGCRSKTKDGKFIKTRKKH